MKKNDEVHQKILKMKRRKRFILIAIWMKSIENSTKSKTRTGIEHFHSSSFLCKSRNCNIAVVVSTKLNRECNVLCFSKQKKLWWHMENVLLYDFALFPLKRYFGKLWMNVIHISFALTKRKKVKFCNSESLKISVTN